MQTGRPRHNMMKKSPLLLKTSQDWISAVLEDFDSFLLDHAAAEKKASGMAMSMLSHYPDRISLVSQMADLAIEELTHYREVLKWIHSRGNTIGPDKKDQYVLALRQHIRQGSDVYLLDRLLIAAVIEARGAERFALIAQSLKPPQIKRFYESLASSEARHYQLFLNLAEEYFAGEVTKTRWQQILDIEAKILTELPIRAALH